MTTRHRNNGLRKVCSCGRRAWTKCAHPWHWNFTHEGVVCRVSLERRIGRLVRTTDAKGRPIWKREAKSLGVEITSKTEVEAEATRLEAALRAGEFESDRPQLATLTLRQLVTLFHERAKAERPQDSTKVLLDTALPRPAGGELAFGDWPVADITTDTVERFREIRSVRQMITRKKEWKPRVAGGAVAANRHLAYLRAVFNWAIRVGYLERTPFKRGTETVVKLTTERVRRRRLEAGELERLFATCAPHVRLMIEAALETGCRKGELLSLQWSQVRFTPRADLFFPADKTKTRRDRRVPMSTRLKAILDMLKTDTAGENHKPEHYVFGNTLGQRIDSIDHAWSAACARAEISGLHFHDLRREAGSRWLEGGVPLNVVKEWLGHANISQTSTYLGVTEASTYEAMRKFDALRGEGESRKDANEKPIASDCIPSPKTPHNEDMDCTDAGQEDTENTDGTRSADDLLPPENRGVDGSIPPLATI